MIQYGLAICRRLCLWANIIWEGAQQQSHVYIARLRFNIL